MSISPDDKQKLRRRLRDLRQHLPAEQQTTAATQLVHRVRRLPLWQPARRIALYIAADGEIDPGPLGSAARSENKQLLLPTVLQGNAMAFARWDADTPLIHNRFAIPQPDDSAQRAALSTIDIVFLPVVGWDRFGGRLGMGGGFYDRALRALPADAASRPLLVGLAHACQEVDRVPTESFDVKLDYVATDNALIHCRGAGNPQTG